MKLSFKLLGYEVWTLDLDFGDEAPAVVAPVTVVDRGTKAVSNWWVKRMMS